LTGGAANLMMQGRFAVHEKSRKRSSRLSSKSSTGIVEGKATGNNPQKLKGKK
jgi:hypothetical protein